MDVYLTSFLYVVYALFQLNYLLKKHTTIEDAKVARSVFLNHVITLLFVFAAYAGAKLLVLKYLGFGYLEIAFSIFTLYVKTSLPLETANSLQMFLLGTLPVSVFFLFGSIYLFVGLKNSDRTTMVLSSALFVSGLLNLWCIEGLDAYFILVGVLKLFQLDTYATWIWMPVFVLQLCLTYFVYWKLSKVPGDKSISMP